MSERRWTVAVDVDGVLHSYTSGWKGADRLPDPPVPTTQERRMTGRVMQIPVGGYSISADGVLSAHDSAGPCAFCDGDGEVVNPGNGCASVAVVDWLRPVICPRCGGTGKEPFVGVSDE